MSPASNSVASRLCLACGLCCNGVLFHTVRLQPNDAPKELAALGLKLKRKQRGDYIIQPCPAFCDGHCAIYAQRPERCQRFECRQLQRVKAGTLTETDALEKICEVQRRAAHLDGLSRRADGSLRKGPLAKRCETALAEPYDPADVERANQRAELALALPALDAMLDADFRVPPEEKAGLAR